MPMGARRGPGRAGGVPFGAAACGGDATCIQSAYQTRIGVRDGDLRRDARLLGKLHLGTPAAAIQCRGRPGRESDASQNVSA